VDRPVEVNPARRRDLPCGLSAGLATHAVHLA
jgi:hypothetical protein